MPLVMSAPAPVVPALVASPGSFRVYFLSQGPGYSRALISNYVDPANNHGLLRSRLILNRDCIAGTDSDILEFFPFAMHLDLLDPHMHADGFF